MREGEQRGSRPVHGDRRVPIGHASRTASREKNRRPKTSAIYGLNAGECYASYDRERRCLKTCQDFLFQMEDGFSTEFCLKFTKAGMMRNGRIYPLRMSGQSILETGFGLSVANRAGGVLFGTPPTRMSMRSGRFRKGNKLPNPAEVAMWPTPDTRGFTNKGSLKMLKEKAGNFEEFAGMAYRQGAGKKEKLWGTPAANDAKNSLAGSQAGRGTLTAQIVESLWPTPRTAGMCGGTGNWEQLKKMCGSIEEARQMGAGNGGRLNPDWVEALMGYPQGWTDIDAEASVNADYPARWLDGTWEEGIPRIVYKAKNRTNRLKGLGNAVVPQIPAVLWVLVARALFQEGMIE